MFYHLCDKSDTIVFNVDNVVYFAPIEQTNAIDEKIKEEMRKDGIKTVVKFVNSESLFLKIPCEEISKQLLGEEVKNLLQKPKPPIGKLRKENE